MQAQEANPPEPPNATGPGGGEETLGKVEREALDKLIARRAKARREFRLLEAQLAEKQAEARWFDASIQVYLTKEVGRLVGQLKQHPIPPPMAADRRGLYVIDVHRGEVAPI